MLTFKTKKKIYSKRGGGKNQPHSNMVAPWVRNPEHQMYLESLRNRKSPSQVIAEKTLTLRRRPTRRSNNVAYMIPVGLSPSPNKLKTLSPNKLKTISPKV